MGGEMTFSTLATPPPKLVGIPNDDTPPPPPTRVIGRGKPVEYPKRGQTVEYPPSTAAEPDFVGARMDVERGVAGGTESEPPAGCRSPRAGSA